MQNSSIPEYWEISLNFLSPCKDDYEIVTPQKLVSHVAKLMNVKKFDVNRVVLMSFSSRVMKLLIEKSRAKRVEKWLYGTHNPLYNGVYKNTRVSIIKGPIGAPATVMLMEELAACGAKTFISLGEAGSIQPYARIGSFVIPTEAIREEGTSYHYLPPEVKVKASEKISTALEKECKKLQIPFLKGKIWTTDAPYRETKSKVDSYIKQGVICVEMELSAMFALGAFRDLNVGGLLIISDELFNGWSLLKSRKGLSWIPHAATQILLETASAVSNS